MNAKARYEQLQADLQSVEKKTGVYLADQCVDHQNCEKAIRDLYQSFDCAPDEYWNEVYRQACNAAGMRAEEAGLDINALMGRNIY